MTTRSKGLAFAMCVMLAISLIALQYGQRNVGRSVAKQNGVENWVQFCVVWRPKGKILRPGDLTHMFSAYQPTLRESTSGHGYVTVVGNKALLSVARSTILAIAKSNNLRVEWIANENR